MTKLYTELSKLVLALKEGEQSSPTEDEWILDRILTPGIVHEISEEEYYFWRGFLPAKWSIVGHYCIQEGGRPFRLFWNRAGPMEMRYFTRQLTWHETEQFCQFAGLGNP
jgi:hypothetical protein